MAFTFGRMDARFMSSVENFKITDSTKRHENRRVGAPGHGHSDFIRVWSLRRKAVEFSKNLHAICTFLSNMK